MRHKAQILVEYHNFLTRNHRPSTIKLYMYIVSELLTFCSKNNMALKKLLVDHIYLFLQRGSYSITYLNNQITIINNFLAWCCSMGIIEVNSFKRIRQLDKTDRQKIILSDTQFKHLNSLMDKTDLKIKVLIKLIYFTGLKVKEITNLKLNDISFKNSQIIIRSGISEVTRSVPFFKELSSDLESYIKSISKESNSKAYLFSKKKGGQIHRREVYRMVSEFLVFFEGSEFGPRIIRNTRGFQLLRSYEHITDISELLNVKYSQAVTYKYTDVKNYQSLQQIYKVSHPRA